jgi:UDP-perosamine 4-acetyltransferase
MEDQPIVILGGGGHAAVVWDCLKLLGRRVEGYVALEPQDTLRGLPWLGDDKQFCRSYTPSRVSLMNGIGMVRAGRARGDLFRKYEAMGYRFVNLIHPSAVISAQARIQPDSGVQIMAGSIVQTDAMIGPNVLINTRAVIEHHAEIGSGVHIAPGSVICGGVRIGKDTLVGAGSTVIQGVRIGDEVTVGAGSVVLRDVPDRVTIMGVPAKEHRIW